MKVLILEDDVGTRETLVELCRILGVDCVAVSNKNDAYLALRKYTFELILIDLLIDGEMATSVIDLAIKFKPKPYIVLCSALNKADKVAKDYKLDYYLKKPFDLNIIEEILTRKTV